MATTLGMISLNMLFECKFVNDAENGSFLATIYVQSTRQTSSPRVTQRQPTFPRCFIRVAAHTTIAHLLRE